MTRFRCIGRVLGWMNRPSLLFVFFSAWAIGIFFWHQWGKGDATSYASQEIWFVVQPQVLEKHLGLVGRIQAVRHETLAAPFDGIISQVLAYEGQYVEPGQVLVSLDPGQIEIQLRQAKADLLRAQRGVQGLSNWYSSPEVSRARRAVQTARATFSNVQANLRDTRGLFERGIVARMEVDTLVQQMRLQEQDLLAAQEELRLVESRGEGEDRTIAEMELANAQARYQALLAQVERQIVKAPFAGFLVSPDASDSGKAVAVQPGLLVSQGASLFVLVGLDQFQVLSQVEETDVQLLREGMPVQITGDGFAGLTLEGRITAIGVQSNATSGHSAYYDVIISLDAPPSVMRQGIRLGMSARLSVILWRNEHGMAIPTEALRDDTSGGKYVIWRATPDASPKKITVTTGKAVLQGVEVFGLEAGEILVFQGSNGLLE